MRRRVVTELRQLNAFSVSAEIGGVPVGAPDVYTVAGWIELKRRQRPPVREHTVLRVPHYTEDQQTFARRETAAGGRVWMLLHVGREWILILTPDEYLGTVPLRTLRTRATRTWPTGWQPGELLATIRSA